MICTYCKGPTQRIVLALPSNLFNCQKLFTCSTVSFLFMSHLPPLFFPTALQLYQLKLLFCREMLFWLLIHLHLSQMLLQVLMCLLVGNLVRLMVWNLVWFLGLRSSLGPELESNLILGLGFGLTFSLESDLKANFSGTGWYLVLFCAHSYYI